jgi:hypothetical protein
MQVIVAGFSPSPSSTFGVVSAKAESGKTLNAASVLDPI